MLSSPRTPLEGSSGGGRGLESSQPGLPHRVVVGGKWRGAPPPPELLGGRKRNAKALIIKANLYMWREGGNPEAASGPQRREGAPQPRRRRLSRKRPAKVTSDALAPPSLPPLRAQRGGVAHHPPWLRVAAAGRRAPLARVDGGAPGATQALEGAERAVHGGG